MLTIADLESTNLSVSPEHVDGVTVFTDPEHPECGQYFTFDAAQIHARLQGKRIPTKEEWEEIIKNTPFEELKKALPLAGYRNYSSAAYSNQGAFGYYWASSPTGAYGFGVILSATQVVPAVNDIRAYGFSVRTFKS
jgi:hypothetical protein